MKHWLAAVTLALVVATGALGAAKGPEINLVDNKLSINAESISLARLLRLLDLATGMKSKVPAELANRNISVKFSGLSLIDGVRKIFQGQPIDYVVIEGQGVIVTAASQSASAADSAPVYSPAAQPVPPQPIIEQPFVQDFPPVALPQPGQQPQQQPGMIQTPFGPIANPRAGQPVPQVAPAPPPVQQNPLFPELKPKEQPTAPVFPGAAPTTPFGTPSPFGAPQSNPNNVNGLFGAPTILSAPGGAQPRP